MRFHVVVLRASQTFIPVNVKSLHQLGIRTQSGNATFEMNVPYKTISIISLWQGQYYLRIKGNFGFGFNAAH